VSGALTGAVASGDTSAVTPPSKSRIAPGRRAEMQLAWSR